MDWCCKGNSDIGGNSGSYNYKSLYCENNIHNLFKQGGASRKMVLENISLFTTIGKDTLYLCGNEFIIKSICSSLVELIGLRLTFNTPLHVYLYTMILLILSIKFLHPLERKFINSIKCI